MKSIYVIGDSSGGALKIGCSKNPAARLGTLQTGHAGQLSLAHSRSADNASTVERVAHVLLKEKRASGEWYYVSRDEAIAAIEAAVELVESGEHLDVLYPKVEGPKSESARVSEWRKDQIEAGAKTVSLLLSKAAVENLDKLVTQYGSKKAAVEAALAAAAKRSRK